MAGAFDLICTNGMYLGEMDKAAARHTASYTPAKFAAFIAGQIQEYSQRARLYQQWAVTEFSRDQFSTVLESAGVFSERRREALLDQYSTEAASRGIHCGPPTRPLRFTLRTTRPGLVSGVAGPLITWPQH